MFDNAGLVPRDQRISKLQHADGRQSVDALREELRLLNIEIPLHCEAGQAVAGGIPCMVSVSKVLGSAFEAEKLGLALRHFMQNNVPVTLSLTDLSKHACATRSLQEFCEYLYSVLSRQGFESLNLGISLHSHQIPLQAFMVISNSILGSGPRYVYLDGLQMRQHCNETVQSATIRNWRFLWQQRHSVERILPVYGGLVRSACPLLSDEIARTILPGTAIVVPESSAWLPVRLSLTDFQGGDGSIDWARLSHSIQKAVQISENLFNHLAWPCWRQRTDARLHRRLAISIDAIGEIVLRSGRDPGSLDCLAWLTGIVTRIRGEIHAASATLAQESGALPAVLRTDPSIGLQAGPARDSWRRRWHAAIQTSALRHRNLLVLSPYAVLPDNAERSAGFTDLLPLIRFADAWCFSTTSTFADWSIDDYQRFHRRAWSVIQGHNEGCVVAAGV